MSSTTVSEGSTPVSNLVSRSLSLESIPPIYILPTHLSIDELHGLEEELLDLGAPLTYNAEEGKVFLGRVLQKKRAAFELRSKGVWTEETLTEIEEPAKKRRRLSEYKETNTLSASSVRGASSNVGARTVVEIAGEDVVASSTSKNSLTNDLVKLDNRILVLRLDWLDECIKQHLVLPFDSFIVYDAHTVPRPAGEAKPKRIPDPATYIKATPAPSSTATAKSSRSPDGATTTILSRAQAEAPALYPKGHPSPHQHRRRLNQSTSPALTHAPRPPKLHRTTTSEFEGDSHVLPDPPSWARDNVVYSCLRSTPLIPVNHRFISELLKIKEARLLTLDEIGVRAYSTSIASLSAYPYLLVSPREVLRLPGCDLKIATLYSDYRDSAEDEESRYLPAARELVRDEHLQQLKLFHDIWGVGPDTARKFYFDRGWKDIDDIVEYGWQSLNRVQQIGVKFYDEFLVPIPRLEVEEIAGIVHRHARKCRGIAKADWGGDGDIEAIIVGGYRKGKERCGDVDMILSHRDEAMTENLVVDVVASLENEGWITHTLMLNTTTSDRAQQTLPFRTEGGGHGFDSLDKALCVWQDPHFEGNNGTKKNPNIHRRVDIIISTWRTVGCAVLGWSGGTTFERDIRRWVKRERGWKFDSSGVRDRATGFVVDLESPKEGDAGDSWLDRERRLMEGLGIGWRDPPLRCTG